MGSYRELDVWQRAMELVVACYEGSGDFANYEVYGLTSQLRRAAVSVPANIAEGRGRQHTAELIQHLAVANGSLAELETHIEIAQRLGYMDPAIAKNLLGQSRGVGRMLSALRNALRRKES